MSLVLFDAEVRDLELPIFPKIPRTIPLLRTRIPGGLPREREMRRDVGGAV